MKYVRKPVEVDAFQLNIDEQPDCFKERINEIFFTEDGCYINTLEGIMHSFTGDYIVQGIEGEIYSCKKRIFEKTYEKLL